MRVLTHAGSRRGARTAALLLCIGTVAACTADGAREGAGVAWRPDSSTRWITLDTIDRFNEVPSGGFAIAGDDLYVASLAASHLTQLQHVGGRWSFAREVALPPGMTNPRTIALLDSGPTLAVLDAHDHFGVLNLATGTSTSLTLGLPCRTLLPQLTGRRGSSDLFMSGDCTVAGGADTVFAFVAVSSDSGRHFRLLTRTPRYSARGTWGSLLGARRFVALSDSVLSFGTGTDACIARFRLGSLERTTDDCTIPSTRYRAPPPTVWDAATMQRELGMRDRHALRWPEPLLPYVDRIATPAGDVYVRLVQTNTLELQLGHARTAAPLVAAPFDGFRGCITSGCLWMARTGHGSVTFRLLTPTALDSLARTQQPAHLASATHE